MSSGPTSRLNGQDSLSGQEPASQTDWGTRLQAAREGSRKEQAKLLETVRPYLLAVAEDQLASDVRPKLAASDIVQNAVWRAWQDFGDFRGQSRAELVGWLRTIICHCVADGVQQFRGTEKRDLSRERSLDQIASEVGVLAESFHSPSGNMMADEQRQKMEQAVRSLSSQHEQVIRLRNDLGLSFAEMGVALACSHNVARKLWLKAVKQLGQELRCDKSEYL
jgi:RNA polymerase sigma-70 factor (ECF subfamily)